MSEAKIPKARLNQIARRKLLSLGINPQLDTGTEALVGQLSIQPPDKLTNPFNGESITKVRFVVEGHDHLRILSPPVMTCLSPQPYFDLTLIAPLISQLQSSLNQHMDDLKQLREQLARLNVRTTPDHDRATITSRIEITGIGSVILEVAEGSLVANRLEPFTSGPSVSLGNTVLSLDKFEHSTDFELYLEQLVKQHSSTSTAPASPEPQAAGSVTGIRLDQLSSVMGPDTVVHPGISLVKDMQQDDQKVRLSARHVQDDQFEGKLTSAAGVVWTGRFSLSQMNNVEEFVSGVLGGSQASPVTVQPEAGHSGFDQEVGFGYQLPVGGEVWVMNLLVEEENEAEIRYVGVDIDGNPFGAPRVLPREAFLATFMSISPGTFRMLVEVTTVEPGTVIYNRLSPSRQRVGNPIRSRLAAFLANFVPEAADY